MEKGGFLKNSQIIVLGLCIAVATIASSFILSQGFLKIAKFTREVIEVTGSAQQDIKSDYIVWRGFFSRREVSLKEAYQKLRDDLEKIKKYLVKKGIAENEIIVAQVVTTTVYQKNEKGNDTNDIQGYVLRQGVEIHSSDVDKISRVSRESTELIDSGIEFESQNPEYFYTRLNELKLEMVAKATQNAKERAIQMAQATGNKIGVMRQARMGVFQITPINSTDVSDWGTNDTGSLEKTVTAVVKASFVVE